MKCPKCSGDLKSSDLGEYGFVVLDVCPQCQGAWFDKGELDRLDESVWTNVEELDFKDVSDAHASLSCPKCSQDLRPLAPNDAKEVVVDRCVSCLGFWLDKGELDRMQDISMAKDSEIAGNMKVIQRPQDWTWIRWSIYCFKEHYFK